MEDVLLVKRAIKGDRQSFEKLMDIYFDRLCREAYIRCKYEEDVKEIVQENIYSIYYLLLRLLNALFYLL